MADHKDLIKKIGLGTVQFGQPYGIANTRGQIPPDEVFEILGLAREKGIDTLDTASEYGTSEEVIGHFLSRHEDAFKIVSKVPHCTGKNSIPLQESLENSLARLKQKKIYGYLIHKFDNLLESPELWGELCSLRKKGLVEKIGVSIYSPNELMYLSQKDMEFDVLQIPYNIFDQRFEEHFSDLKNRKVEIHARSPFLQGLFFLNHDRWTGKFKPVHEKMQKIQRLSAESGVPVWFLCLGFVLLNPSIDKVLMGVDSLTQLQENLHFSKHIIKIKSVYEELKKLRIDDEEIILPSRWNRP